MAQASYDLIIIGAGPGGYTAAIRAAQLGLNVACIEQEPQLGGTCLRVGCIPSKALLESSERFEQAKDHLAAHGVVAKGVTLDLKGMLKRKDDIVSGLTGGVAHLLKKNGVTRLQGHGRILGQGDNGQWRIGIEGKDGGQEVSAAKVILATGSVVSDLPGVEVDYEKIVTSSEALTFQEVPKHLVVIGAGVIGLELGSVWRRLGAQVTVLEYAPRILPTMDQELAQAAEKIFTKQGLKFRLGVKVVGARADAKGCVVQVEGSDPIACDRVLLAVGRKANTDKLGLEQAAIVPDRRGRISVNAHFETSAKGIYAIGDVIEGAMLAHKAEDEAVAVVEQMVTGFGHVDYNTIAGIVYTEPEIASVGATEEALKEAGIAYKKGSFPFIANGRARAKAATQGMVKILADAKTDRILGGHIIGAQAGDLIMELVTAMSFGASSEDVARVCHPHPCLAEAVREAALAVDGRTLNI